MELTHLHSHLIQSWMVLGLEVSFAQVVRTFLEDCTGVESDRGMDE